jgi:hypothetical protein
MSAIGPAYMMTVSVLASGSVFNVRRNAVALATTSPARPCSPLEMAVVSASTAQSANLRRFVC